MNLPTFQQVRLRTQRELVTVLDGMRFDWDPNQGPTDQQDEAWRDARILIALAQEALNQAEGR